jgi:hypothetical protein
LAAVKRIAPIGSVLAIAALLTVSLAGCQAGANAQTAQQYDPVDGRNVNVPSDAGFGDPYIAVRGALLVDVGTTTSVVVTLVNNTDSVDTLQAVAVNGMTATLSDGPVPVPVGVPVSLGENGIATAEVELQDVAPGDWATLTLTFAESGIATFDVLAVTPAQMQPIK